MSKFDSSDNFTLKQNSSLTSQVSDIKIAKEKTEE